MQKEGWRTAVTEAAATVPLAALGLYPSISLPTGAPAVTE